MRRFALNRWCAFVLTLCVLLASSTVMAPSSFGEGSSPEPIVIGGGGSPDPGGDPDGTSGGGNKRGTGTGRAVPGGYWFSMTSVGDGGHTVSVWVVRLHVVLRSLTSRLYRF